MTTAGGTPTDRYAALWVEKSGGDDARMYVGATADQETRARNRLKDATLIPRTSHALRGPDGEARYSGVWGRPHSTVVSGEGYRDLLRESFEQNLASLSDQLLIDVAVSEGVPMQTTRERAHPAGAGAETSINAQPGDRDAIRDDPVSAEIKKAVHFGCHYAAVWTGDASFEATPILGLTPAEQLRRGRALAGEGYRPMAWSAVRTARCGSASGRLGLAPARGRGRAQRPAGRAAGTSGDRIGSPGQSRGSLAPFEAQCRSSAAQFHRQLAQTARR